MIKKIFCILTLLTINLIVVSSQNNSNNDLELLELFTQEAKKEKKQEKQEKKEEDIFDIFSTEEKKQTKKIEKKEEDLFAIFSATEEKKQKKEEDLFQSFLLPEEKKKKEKDIFSSFELPSEKSEQSKKAKESDIFGAFDLPEKGRNQESTEKEKIRSKAGEDWEEFLERNGSKVLENFNPYFLFHNIKKLSKDLAKKPQPKAIKKPESVSPKTESPKQIEENIANIEEEILKGKELDLQFLSDLENLEIQVIEAPKREVIPDSTLQNDLKFLSELDIEKTSTEIEIVEAPRLEEKEEEIGPSFIKGTYSYDFAVLSVPDDGFFNPDNIFNIPKTINRNLVRFILDYDIYSDPSSFLFLKLYGKNTFVYADPSFSGEENFTNYLQEIYCSFLYQQFSFSLGKMNVQGGDGGLAYNPTDYFAFPSDIFHPKDGNIEKRGIRSGFLAVQAGYSLPFGSISFLYSPDLTRDGDVRENSELQNNQENVYYAKFTWILFDSTNKYAVIGSLGDTIVPASPEFFFSYFDRQHLFNAGFSWSIGLGDMTILKLEGNYSNRTKHIIDLKSQPSPGPPLFAIEDRKGSNFQFIAGITYTPSKFNINLQYFFNYNGLSRNEMDSFFDKAQFLRDNRNLPGIGELYFGILQQTGAILDPSLAGQHYFISSIDYSFYIGVKKRSLVPEIFFLLNLQDNSGVVGGSLKYEALNFLKMYANLGVNFGKKQSLFGSSPAEMVFTFALDMNF